MTRSARECPRTRELCGGLRALGAVTYAAVGGLRSVPGWPDRWVGHRRWSGWLEFKGPGGTLAPAQAACLRDIEARTGHGAYVVWLGQPAGAATLTWHDETVLAVFDGTAGGLLECLERAEQARRER